MSRRNLVIALVACIFFGGLSLKLLVGGLLFGDYSTVFWASVAYTGWLTGAIMVIAELAGWRHG